MIAILADIHANRPALEAVLKDMPDVSSVWVLGDMIGELPYPCEVLDMLLNLPVPVIFIAGNREVSLLEAKRGEHPDWWEGTQMRVLAWTADRLMPYHWEHINSLPNVLTLEEDKIPYGAVLFHGTPQEVRGLIHTREQALAAAHGFDQRWLACGHSHQARLFHIGNQIVLNAGSVGLNLDGLGGFASYALIDERSGIESMGNIVFRRVSYDVEKVVDKIMNGEMYELAPGICKADILELRTGRHHVLSLIEFCHSYAERYLGHSTENIPPEIWCEAEKLWDGKEWLNGRMQ